MFFQGLTDVLIIPPHTPFLLTPALRNILINARRNPKQTINGLKRMAAAHPFGINNLDLFGIINIFTALRQPVKAPEEFKPATKTKFGRVPATFIILVLYFI